MKKLFLFTLLLLFFFQTVSAKEQARSSAGVSIGHSWFHKYSEFSKHGMNISLDFEPALDRYFKIDSSLALHIYFDDVAEEFVDTKRKITFFAPQLTFGPGVALPFFKERFFLFFGTGLNFLVGIDYSHKTGKAQADFSPGFYGKAGFEFVFAKFITLGINSKYCWSTIHNPHILSLNFSLKLSYY